MRRWNASTMMMSGMVTSAPAAMTEAYGYSKWLSPENRAIATVTGSVASVDSCLASMNSFQVAMKHRIAVVKSAGAASGSKTVRNAVPRDAPSTRAASSNSHGNWRKNDVNV